MPFIISEFGTYSEFVAWNPIPGRQFIVKLINNDLSTEEIVKYEPAGLTGLTMNLYRSPDYHGVFETLSTSLDFPVKTGGGGTFLRAAYANKAILASVDVEIYSLNSDTNDYDILCSYSAILNESNYVDNIDTISIRLTQKGIWQTFSSRDELELDITKNTSVDGVTVTDISSVNKSFPGIDVHLLGELSGSITHSTENYSSSLTEYDLFDGTSIHDETYGRIQDTISDGIFYINDSSTIRYLKLDFIFTGTLNSTVDAGNSITITYQVIIYNSSDIIITTENLGVINNLGEGYQIKELEVDYSSTYITVPVGGYAVFRAKVEVIYTSGTCIIDPLTMDEQSFNISEKSPSFGATTIKTYRFYDALLKSARLITGVNDCLTTSSLTTHDFYRAFLTNGRYLRANTLGIAFNMNFLEAFKNASHLEGLCLYYGTDGKIHIDTLVYAYQNVQVVDFGVVNDFRSYPSNHYYNKIEAGCDTDGKYNEEQGAKEFNTKHSYNTIFKFANVLQLLTTYRTDSLAFEYARRMQYRTDGSTDSDYDNLNYVVFTSVDGTIQVGSMTGFEVVSQYYNRAYIAREMLIKNGGILAGMFWKETGKEIIFASNKKDIDISYATPRGGTDDLKENIPQATLGSAYFFPETQEFEAEITTTQLTAIRTNPHGYYVCKDKNGVEHKGYFDAGTKIELYNKKIQVKGLTANR